MIILVFQVSKVIKFVIIITTMIFIVFIFIKIDIQICVLNSNVMSNALSNNNTLVDIEDNDLK